MKKVFAFLSFLAFALPLSARADGMIMPPPDTYQYESGQRAVLLYDESSSSETLVVSIRFQGRANNFAWIIPVPSEPTVSQGSESLFTSLETLTDGGMYRDVYSMGSETGSADKEASVDVVRVQSIDYYSVATLTSTDSQALATWLQDNGYQYPTGSEYILNNYIENNWYFVAVKIDLTKIASAQANALLNEGTATPLKLVFSARNPVYPMRISSITGRETTRVKALLDSYTGATAEDRAIAQPSSDFYPSSIPVELYVLAKHKQTLPGFSTTYGNFVTKKTMEGWAVDSQGDPLLLHPASGKYFLTKLTRSFTTAQMTEDLFPRQADNDKKVSVTGETSSTFNDAFLILLALSIFTILAFTIGTLSPFGVLFIVATIVQFRVRSRAWRVAAWVVQCAVTALYTLVGVFVILAGSASSSSFFSIPGEILSSSHRTTNPEVLWAFMAVLSIAGFLALLVATMVLQAKKQRAERR